MSLSCIHLTKNEFVILNNSMTEIETKTLMCLVGLGI